MARPSPGADADTAPRPIALKLIADLRCSECGSFGAFDLGDRPLCEDCYRTRGSCCMEFGADDLWSKDE